MVPFQTLSVSLSRSLCVLIIHSNMSNTFLFLGWSIFIIHAHQWHILWHCVICNRLQSVRNGCTNNLWYSHRFFLWASPPFVVLYLCGRTFRLKSIICNKFYDFKTFNASVFGLQYEMPWSHCFLRCTHMHTSPSLVEYCILNKTSLWSTFLYSTGIILTSSQIVFLRLADDAKCALLLEVSGGQSTHTHTEKQDEAEPTKRKEKKHTHTVKINEN